VRTIEVALAAGQGVLFQRARCIQARSGMTASWSRSRPDSGALASRWIGPGNGLEAAADGPDGRRRTE
jgi:hypothetical protein